MSAYERGVKRGLEVWSNVQELKERGRSVTVVSEGKSDGEGKGKSELSSTTEKQKKKLVETQPSCVRQVSVVSRGKSTHHSPYSPSPRIISSVLSLSLKTKAFRPTVRLSNAGRSILSHAFSKRTLQSNTLAVIERFHSEGQQPQLRQT